MLARLPMTSGQLGLALEDRRRHVGQHHRVAGSADGVRRLLERVDRRRRAAGAVFHVVDRHAVDIVRLRQRSAQLDRRQRRPLAARRGVVELCAVLVEPRDQPVDQVTRAGMRDVPHDRRDVDDAVALQHTQLVVVKEQQLHVECSFSRWVRRYSCGSCCRSPWRGGPCRSCPRPAAPPRRRSCGFRRRSRLSPRRRRD